MTDAGNKSSGNKSSGNKSSRATTLSVAEMREAFDSTFARSRSTEAVPTEDLLAVSAGSHRCALRLAEMSRLAVDRKLTVVPASMNGLLGIAHVHGTVTSVYSLGALLGAGRLDAPPRWIAVGADRSIGFAFDQLRGYVRVPSADLDTDLDLDGPSPDRAGPTSRAVQVDGTTHPIVSLAALTGEIAARTRQDVLQREER